MSTDAFSNPTLPVEFKDEESVHPKKLSNADFRSILNTPRVGKDELSQNSSAMHPPRKLDDKKRPKKHNKPHRKSDSKSDKPNFTPTSKNYRDRAKERRDGKVPNTENSPEQNQSGQYKAVSGNIKDNIVQAENRKQQIEKSKFLGGDPNTTHLVKGLDYVLLEKTRNQVMLQAEKGKSIDVKKGIDELKLNSEDDFKTTTCRNIMKTLFLNKQPIVRNTNFIPGKMAFRFDLGEEFAEFDVPTTIHRSIAEVGNSDDYNKNLSSSKNVISMLTNILAYHRGEKKQAKKAKQREKISDHNKDNEDKDFDMFADLPSSNNKNSREDRRKTHSDRHHRSSGNKRHDEREDKKSRYFDDSAVDEDHVPHGKLERAKHFIQSQEKRNIPNKEAYELQLLSYLRDKVATTGYSECYPTTLEGDMTGVGGGDDEEDEVADYTHMDRGTRKGPVGRWDFENNEEYGEYMSQREALPKAVFQYGVKMADGRKTRRVHGAGEKAALEKEWKQIQDLWKDGPPVSKKSKKA